MNDHCESCGGTGTCQVCEGLTLVNASEGLPEPENLPGDQPFSGQQREAETMVRCQSCRGTGKCQQCSAAS